MISTPASACQTSKKRHEAYARQAPIDRNGNETLPRQILPWPQARTTARLVGTRAGACSSTFAHRAASPSAVRPSLADLGFNRSASCSLRHVAGWRPASRQAHHSSARLAPARAASVTEQSDLAKASTVSAAAC